MSGIRNIAIDGFIFRMTCECCPEQYDVYKKDNLNNIVAYVRLRHGWLYAVCPDVDGEMIYSRDLDVSDGYFISEEERIEHLTNIKNNIVIWLQKEVREDEQN